MWDTAIGFVGFFAFLALVQAVMNLFASSPALWPGILAAVLVLATFALIHAKRARFNDL